jgi:hypothetical protein
VIQEDFAVPRGYINQMIVSKEVLLTWIHFGNFKVVCQFEDVPDMRDFNEITIHNNYSIKQYKCYLIARTCCKSCLKCPPAT